MGYFSNYNQAQAWRWWAMLPRVSRDLREAVVRRDRFYRKLDGEFVP